MRLYRQLLLAFLLATTAVVALAQSPRDLLVGQWRASDFRARGPGAMPVADWLLHGNGAIEAPQFIVPHDTSAALGYHVDILAYGTAMGPRDQAESWPLMKVSVDGTWIGSVHVTSRHPKVWRLSLPTMAAGLRNLRIEFVNDAHSATEDRNLYVKRAELRMGAAPALPAGQGSFGLQSVTIHNGFFPSNALHYGEQEPCDPTFSGCRNIPFIKRLGASDVTFTSVCTLQPGASWCRPQINGDSEEAALRVAIRHARALGLTVTLKPFVLGPNGELLATYVSPETGQKWLPANPYEFYQSVESNLLRHARIAREEGVSLLMIGAEFGGRFTSGRPMGGYGDWCPRWGQMIANARAAAAAVTAVPTGAPAALAMTYSATFAGFWNDVDANEAPYVCFWDRLDHIGLNAYPHMNLPASAPAARLQSGMNVHRRMFLPTNPNEQDDDDMAIADTTQVNGALLRFVPEVAGFEAFDLRDRGPRGYQARYNTTIYSTKWVADHVIDRINERFAVSLKAQKKYPLKAILTEVGVPSSQHVHGFWGESEPGPRLAGDAVFQDEQAVAWDGLLRAFYGDPRIAGISVWGLMPNHDAAYGPVAGWELAHDFNGKVKAAEVVCQWFKGAWRGNGDCLAMP